MKRLVLVCALIAAPALAEEAVYETLVPGETGAVTLGFDVSPSGHVENCVVERSSGFPRLDAASCRMMVRKARYAPSAGRTRETTAIRWVSNAAADRAATTARPHPFGDGEGMPDDWAALNPEWGGGGGRK